VAYFLKNEKEGVYLTDSESSNLIDLGKASFPIGLQGHLGSFNVFWSGAEDLETFLGALEPIVRYSREGEFDMISMGVENPLIYHDLNRNDFLNPQQFVDQRISDQITASQVFFAQNMIASHNPSNDIRGPITSLRFREEVPEGFWNFYEKSGGSLPIEQAMKFLDYSKGIRADDGISAESEEDSSFPLSKVLKNLAGN